ncbi:MAG: hypothetical protein KAJ55_09635 [Anaerolineales bacterium]|nr:hypothetical protein [Anaerolineales bacterium]
MTDFAGVTLPTIGPAGPFPDPDVGDPKPTGLGANAYPSATLDFSDPAVVPSLYDPFERVRTFLTGFGVDPFNPDAVAEVEDGSTLAGVNQGVEASLGPFQSVAGFVSLDQPSDWFEKWHVFPGRLDLGNVLTTQIRNLELFNGFRNEARTWEAFINNAGAGVAVTNLPGLPLVLASLESFVLDVQVTTAGPPSITGTLDFDIDTPIDFLIVPITGTRITLFQYRPQSPITETLQFKTDIIEVNDGSEQRINVRENPRQIFKFSIRTDDDRTRDSINAVLYDWQSRVFGVPVWHESKALGAPLAIGNTIVTVDTAFADFRAGGLAMIYDNNFRTETLEIDAVNPNDIVLQVGVSKAFDAVNTIVLPVRTALTRPQLSQARFSIGPTDFQVEFTTLDNVDLASQAAFPTYLGGGQTVAKPLIDRLNFMKGSTVKEGIRRKVVRLDPETGPALQFSSWTKGKPSFNYGFEGKSFEDTWDFRQLLHFLRGSQLAFYVGTGRNDFKAVADIADTSTQIDFENFGFTQFVQEITPRSDLQILRADGTVSQHLITGSVVVSDTVERITISPAITPALPLVDIDRIEFLTLSRISNDAPKFSHTRPGESRIDFNLTGVPS